MTILGKILAIFVFLFSLIWFGLTVNLYATRAEWKKAYESARKDAERNAKDTDDLKAQLQRERAAIAGREQAAAQSVAAVAAQLKDTQQRYEQLLASAGKVADTTAAFTPQLREYDALIKKTQDQVDNLTTANVTMSSDRDAYAKTAQLATNKANDAELQANILKRALEAKTDLLTRMQEEKIGAGVVGAESKFRGQIGQVSGDLVAFDGGLNAGVKVGNTYKVTRATDPFFVGTITVTVSDQRVSAGSFTPAKGQRMTGKYVPQPGDTVESN
jgi:hypothetical protein